MTIGLLFGLSVHTTRPFRRRKTHKNVNSATSAKGNESSPEALRFAIDAFQFLVDQGGLQLVTATTENDFEDILERQLFDGSLCKSLSEKNILALAKRLNSLPPAVGDRDLSEVIATIPIGPRKHIQEGWNLIQGWLAFNSDREALDFEDPLGNPATDLSLDVVFDRFSATIAQTWYESLAIFPVLGAIAAGTVFKGTEYWHTASGKASAFWFHKSARAWVVHLAARGLRAPRALIDLGEIPDFQALQIRHQKLRSVFKERSIIAVHEGRDVGLVDCSSANWS